MRRVVIESPLAGDLEANTVYARECLLDSLRRGESPIAGHLLYPQVLNDDVRAEREQGIQAHLEWIKVADAVVVYCDRGITIGMRRGIACGLAHNLWVEYRYLESLAEVG